MLKMNEATLEARLHAVLEKTFPWIKPEEIKHQKVFTVYLGRNAFKVDGSVARETSNPRLDILITHNNKNLAVLELKAPSENLTENDEKQGVSYARLLDEIAPLTIVTNGNDTRIINTFTRKCIESKLSEKTLSNVINSACKMATQDVTQAILSILGCNINIWKSAVYELSKQHFEDALNGKERSGIVFRRKISDEITEAIKTPENNLILLHGDTLIGKTMLLYDIFLRQEENKSYYMLYIPAENNGFFEIIAKTLSYYLGCEISIQEAESLLSKHSNNTNERLLIAYDDLEPRAVQSIKDIKTITEYLPARFGKGICILGVFNSLHERSFTIKANGRDYTPLKKRAKKVYRLMPLDDEELETCCKTLMQHKIGFMRGFEYNPIYRELSLLDILITQVKQNDENSDSIAKYPPVITEAIFDFSEELYDMDMRLLLLKIVKQIINEFSNNKLPPAEFQLFSLRHFSILEESLKEILCLDEIIKLQESGYIKKAYTDRYAFCVLPLQRLTASLFKNVATDYIKYFGNDADKICYFLVFICSNIRFGEIIAAKALYDALRNSDLFFSVITVLHQNKPIKEEVEISDNARITIEIKGHYIEMDKKSLNNFMSTVPATYSKTSLMPWLIISHLLCMEKVYQLQGLIDIASFDGILISPELMNIMPLHVHTNRDGKGFLCSNSGMIEVIIYAIFTNIVDFSEGELVNFCNTVIENKNSIFLLNRVHTALVASLGVCGANSELLQTQTLRIAELVKNTMVNCPGKF